MSTPETSRTGTGAYVLAAIGALLIMAALVALTRQFTTPAPLGADRAAERKKALAELRGEEHTTLTTYGWQDKTREIVRLPIARAVELTLQTGDAAALRKDRLARLEKATAAPPKAPEQPSAFE
jgi:hypothetical protein